MKKAQCAHPPPFDNDDLIGSNQCLYLQKAELSTKNSTKRQLCCCLVEFLVQLDSLEKSVSANEEKCVDFKPTFLET